MDSNVIKNNFIKLMNLYNINRDDTLLCIDEVTYNEPISVLKLMIICIELGTKNANNINNSNTFIG